MGYRCALVLIAMAALLAEGCHALKLRPKPNYETLSADPRHDTKKAIAKTDRGVVLMEKGDLEKAEKHLQEALVADVTYAPAHNNLGSLYLQRGEFYLAAWEFEYAIKLMRDRAEPHNNLGMVYEAVGRFDDAISQYEIACRNEPRSAEFLGNLARAHVRRGDQPDMVRPMLEQLIFLDTRPDWVDWAREYLALHNPSDRPATPDTPTTPEAVPPPQASPSSPEPLPPPKRQSSATPLNTWPTAKSQSGSESKSIRTAQQPRALGPTNYGKSHLPPKDRPLLPLKPRVPALDD